MVDATYVSYGILAGDTITVNSNITHVYGNAGSNISAGSGILLISGQQNQIIQPLEDAQIAYDAFMAMIPTTTSSVANIGGVTFTPGVIELNNVGGVTIGGTVPNNRITLNGGGQYVFQITNGGLTTDTLLNTVSIHLTGGALASQIYWVVNGSVDLQTQGSNITHFKGTVICQGNINLGTNSTSYGSLVAVSSTGSITLSNNHITSQIIVEANDRKLNDYVHIESQLSDNKAIKIIASDVNGGIDISAGLGGINIETTNSISLNSAAASNFTTSNDDLTLEATNGFVNIDAGLGINIGVTSSTPVINISTSDGGRIFNRFGTGGFIKHQESHVAISDTDATLTVANLLAGILSGTPTVDRTLTLPTAALAVAGVSGVEIGDSITFYIINKSTPSDEAKFILALGTGGSIEGKVDIDPTQDNTGTYFTSGSAMFKLRFTNVSGGTEEYTVYRLG